MGEMCGCLGGIPPNVFEYVFDQIIIVLTIFFIERTVDLVLDLGLLKWGLKNSQKILY